MAASQNVDALPARPAAIELMVIGPATALTRVRDGAGMEPARTLDWSPELSLSARGFQRISGEVAIVDENESSPS